MEIPERLVDTPTVARLKLRAVTKGRRPYFFVIGEHDLLALRGAGLSLSTAVAFACIKGAAGAARRRDWVTLRPRTLEAVGKDFRWWYSHTSQLEQAGFIECQRHRGRLPRYRLRASKKPRRPNLGRQRVEAVADTT